MKTMLVNHQFIKIEMDPTKPNLFVYVHVAGRPGLWIRHADFPNDLRGHVAALDFAAQVVAGKFCPMDIVEGDPTGGPKTIEDKGRKLIE